MTRLIALMFCGASHCAAAQFNVTYPYNPDWNGDSLITVMDLQDLLSIYGAAFSPGDVEVGEHSLPEVLATIMSNQLEMQAVIAAQQAYIDTLQQHLSVTDGLVLIQGANLQVVSGSGQTDGEINGKGNVIVGYNEDFANVKSGSHNLVIGSYHNYSSFGGLVAGYENSIWGEFCTVTGGAFNTARDISCAILGGKYNLAEGNMTTIAGGLGNAFLGNESSILGSSSNIADENRSTVVGDGDRTYFEFSLPGFNVTN